MADYRIYLFGADSKLLNSVEIPCESFSGPLRQMLLSGQAVSRMELWLDGRLISKATSP